MPNATMRFWINVESLNRPPTLLTMASSFQIIEHALDLLRFGKTAIQQVGAISATDPLRSSFTS